LASGNANPIAIQVLCRAVTQIRLAELKHFPTLKRARIARAAADFDTREE
jgi:hypothetical protein